VTRVAGRSYRTLRRAAAVVTCLVAATALLTGSPAAGSGAARPFRVLQMNLCDSGMAGCYTGRSVAEAAYVIRADAPDLVTLNEICADDVVTLARTMADVFGEDAVAHAFQAAEDRRTGGPFRCRNGQPYGIGLLAHISSPGYTTYGGIYPTQDTHDPEERAWLCVDAAADFYGCTTHLANTSTAVALAQCVYLLDVAVPAVRLRGGYRPTVVGGDLNLRYGGTPDVRACVPSAFLRKDDGGVQHVVATPDFRVTWSRSSGMAGTTDHPSLLVGLTGRH
jgi:hypothetical protein